MAAPTFVAASALGNSTAGSFTITLPTHLADDVFLCLSWYRASATVATPADWTEARTWLRGTTRYYLHWRRAASGAETDPVFDYTGADDGFGLVCSYRGCVPTGTPYDVLGTEATGTANTATLNGITTLTADSLVVALIGGEDNTATACTMTATDPAAFTEHYAESATGTDGCVAIGEAAKAATGATGDVSAAWGTSVVGWGGIVLALIPPASVQSHFEAAVTATGVMAAGLTTAIRVAAAVGGSAVLTGALTTAITCAGSLSGTAEASGTLTFPSAHFEASVSAAGTTTGALTTAIRLVAGMSGSGTAAADLTTAIRCAATVTGTMTIDARLTVNEGDDETTGCHAMSGMSGRSGGGDLEVQL